MMKKLVLGLLTVTLLSGCGTKEAKLSMEDAEKAALQEFQGDIIKSDTERDDGVVVYEFTIDNGQDICEVEVDGNTGHILKSEIEDDRVGRDTPDSQETQQSRNSEPVIGEEEAKQAALERSGTGEVVRCELDRDNGKMKYEIEIRDGNKEIDVDVDAVTKEILRYEEDMRN